jgi:signal transduction histidine kinase
VLVSSDVWHLDEPERFRGFRTITATTAFARGEGLPGRVLENGQPFWIVNLVEDENFTRAKLSSEIGLKPAFAFPVPVRGEVAAVIEFFSTEPQEVDEDLLMKMSQVGDQIGPVTERNRAFEKLADAMKKTELAKRAKTDFLANMSHELRTPLNSIIGFSEVVLNEVFGPIGNARYEDYLVDIDSLGQHLLELINDILDVSKVEAGAMELMEEDLHVEHVIGDAVRVVKDRAKEVEIDLSDSVGSLYPKIKADFIRVKQILLNLLSNAVKFTPEGGKITVGAYMENDGSMAMFVTDTGIGISENELKKVLEPFTQAPSGLDRRHEGTGLPSASTRLPALKTNAVWPRHRARKAARSN